MYAIRSNERVVGSNDDEIHCHTVNADLFKIQF